MNWTGTFLNAVFIARGIQPRWSEVLRTWAEAGVLEAGKAVVSAVTPAEATHQGTMAASVFAEIEWDSGAATALPTLQKSMLQRLILPLHPVMAVGDLLVDVFVNPDDTVSIYLSVPYNETYEQAAPAVRVANLRRFVDLACRFFIPPLFLAGAIGEEARIDGIADLRADPGLLVDWAFYGATITAQLGPGPGQVQGTAKEWRSLSGSGLFVRWTDWQSPPDAPEAWRQAVARALAAAVS